MHPPEKLETNANPSVSNLPTTQQATSLIACLLPKDEFKDLQKLIMLFPSIGFTRTMVMIIGSTFNARISFCIVIRHLQAEGESSHAG